jgi:hypothetical protein
MPCSCDATRLFFVPKRGGGATLVLMLTRVDARRRWFGTLFIILSLGMLMWGVTFLADRLVKHPLMFVLYWGGCAIFTGLALINALLDMMIMRKRSRDEQISLAKESFGRIQEEAKKRDVE